MKKNIALFAAGSALLGSLLVAAPAFAQTTPTNGFGGRMMMHVPGVFGTVAATNGDTLTVNSKGFGPNATATTYTVDATNATVMKDGAASSVGNIAVGDMVMAQGTVSGTSVTATTIRDGVMGRGGMGTRPGNWAGHASSTPQGGSAAIPQGNGQPVVGGTVSAISGSTLTITNKSNVTYTVDASSATVNKAGAASTLGSVSTGDNVIVQGAVNGNSVTASSVIDQGAPQTTATGSISAKLHAGFGGIMGGIGGFFQHLFGFF